MWCPVDRVLRAGRLSHACRLSHAGWHMPIDHEAQRCSTRARCGCTAMGLTATFAPALQQTRGMIAQLHRGETARQGEAWVPRTTTADFCVSQSPQWRPDLFWDQQSGGLNHMKSLLISSQRPNLCSECTVKMCWQRARRSGNGSQGASCLCRAVPEASWTRAIFELP